jgi:hypothetical protein
MCLRSTTAPYFKRLDTMVGLLMPLNPKLKKNSSGRYFVIFLDTKTF